MPRTTWRARVLANMWQETAEFERIGVDRRPLERGQNFVEGSLNLVELRKLGRTRQDSFARTNLLEVGPKVFENDHQSWSVRIGLTRPGVGRKRLTVGRLEMGTKRALNRPNFGRCRSNFGRTEAKLGPPPMHGQDSVLCAPPKVSPLGYRPKFGCRRSVGFTRRFKVAASALGGIPSTSGPM